MRDETITTASRAFGVNEADARVRLDRFLAARVDDLSRMRIANLIAAGACKVNGGPARAGRRLAAGDLVELFVEDDLPGAMSPDPIPLEILFEDDHLVVVVKPAGMLVHPTRSVKRGTLANALTYHLNRSRIGESADASNLQSEARNRPPHLRPGIVHRLDRETSGLMVVAKTQRALRVLSQHFKRRLIEKRYLALVRGCVPEDQGVIEARIGRDPDRVPHWRVMENGKAAETRFRVISRSIAATFVELEPVTGRTNQLRIHMAFVGHPIIGDALWDAECGKPFEGADPSLPCLAERSTNTPLCLHASRLCFHHPSHGQWLEFSATPERFSISG